MLRFFVVIIKNLLHLYMVPRMEYMAAHKERYSLEQRYRYALLAIKRMKRAGRIYTKGYGTENLPKEGGYVMFPNHQGKYDALGIICTHKSPCSVVIDEAKSHTFLVRQFIDLIEGKRLKKDDIRQSVKVIMECAKETAQGKKFIIFPEGGYDHNGNDVQTFKPGAFKSAIKAKVPIVPVALVDSYKPFELWGLGSVVTQVHYLEPLYYEEYKDMQSWEIAGIVTERIRNKICQVTA